jgi:hypothetical protein
MRRRKTILGILALVVCGVLAVVFWPEKPEPVYKGKRLSEWVVDFGSNQPNALAEAVEAIETLGTNGIPYYLKWIRCQPSFLKSVQSRLVARSCNLLNLSAPKDNKLLRAWGAYVALAQLGERAEPAIPQLLEYITNSGGASYYGMPESHDAVDALVEIGRPALPALLSLTTSSNEGVRLMGIEACKQFCTDAQLVGKIERMLRDSDWQVRSKATNLMKDWPRRFRPVN